MRMRFHFVLAVFCLGLVLCCGETAGTTIERFSIERLTNVAQVIVRGRCVSNVSRWENGEIWTITSFEVAETWKGSQTGQLSVYLLGGTLAGLTSNVPGVPRFRVGEDVILFLEPTKHAGLTIVSWQQGTFRVGRDMRTGMEIVTQDTATFETLDPESKIFHVAGIRDLPLEAFRTRVQAAVVGSARRQP